MVKLRSVTNIWDFTPVNSFVEFIFIKIKMMQFETIKSN